MATIKINYGGTTYSMVKTSSKITSPSVAVDGGWIPCFKGDRFAEVKSGDRIYTLSPIMVNGYRMACGSRIAFNGTVYVHIPYRLSYIGSASGSSWKFELLPIKTASTNVTGYSCILSNVIWAIREMNPIGSFSSGYPSNASITQNLTANYTVFDSSHNAVKTGAITNKLITIDPVGQGTGDYESKVAI